MKSYGHILYDMYREELAKSNVSCDEFYALDKLDQEAWERLAERVMDGELG